MSRPDNTEYAECDRYALPIRGKERREVVIEGNDYWALSISV